MKNIKYIFLAMVSLLTVASCETDADTVAAVKDEAGALIKISASSNSAILGSPESGVDLKDAIVSIATAYLDMTISMTSGSQNDIAKVEVVKSYNGGEEIVLGESATLPYNLVVSSLDDFLAGTGVTADKLRIGDQITFKTKITQKDGDVYYYNSGSGHFNLTVNCSADLSGTYLVTNDACMPSFTTTISKNDDGTWYIESGDGGFLHLCTGNSTLVNWANITVICGVVQPSGNLRFGSDGGTYDIGDISGGSWDQENGVLTMNHSQNLTSNWVAGEWTSTYTRQ